jgi:hypothetical protein
MKTNRRYRRQSSIRRRGLAPFELVLAIPVLFFVVGLSVVFCTITSWKVRTQTVARNAIWSHRWPRSDVGIPSPGEWPPQPSVRPTVINWNQWSPIQSLEHAAFQHPVIRGPLPNNIVVNDQLFDPTLRIRIGEAFIVRDPPALARLGSISLDVDQPIVDGKWQFGQTGQASNRSRRVPSIYPDLLDPAQARSLEMRYQQSIQTMLAHPCQAGLAVLDRDQEIFAWYGYYPDFHPRFPRFCALDPDFVRQTYLPGHLDRVDCHTRPDQQGRGQPGVPDRLTSFFLSMYRHQKWVLENSMPPGSPAEIAELDRKIAILEEFEQYLSQL